MDSDSVFIEASFMLARHSGDCDLTPEAAAMFALIRPIGGPTGAQRSPNRSLST